MPLNTLNTTNPEPQKGAQAKFRIHKWHNEVERELGTFVNETKLKKIAVKDAIHMCLQDSYDTMLKATSVSPSPRKTYRRGEPEGKVR